MLAKFLSRVCACLRECLVRTGLQTRSQQLEYVGFMVTGSDHVGSPVYPLGGSCQVLISLSLKEIEWGVLGTTTGIKGSAWFAYGQMIPTEWQSCLKG